MNLLAGSNAGRWAAAVCTAFAAGVAAGHSSVGVAPTTRAAVAAAASIACALVLCVRRGLALMISLVVVAALLGGARGSAAAFPGPTSVAAHVGTRDVVVLGSVRDTSTTGAVVVDATRITDSDADTGVSGGVLVSAAAQPAVMPGDQVEIHARGLRLPGRRPGATSQAALEREGVQGVAMSPQMSVVNRGAWSPSRAVASMQARLTHAVDASIPEPAAALLLGVAFGIRQPLAADIRAPLQDAGLVHIVVVSGLKVVIVLGLIAAVAARRGWSRWRALVVSAPLVSGYVLLSGAGPAAVRSAIMTGAALLAGTAGRRTDSVPMLSLVAAVMLGIQPQLVDDPGFQLSFLGTLGIVLLASPLAVRIPGPRVLVEPFAVTVAAQLATVPVMAGTFGVISIVGPIANALVLPVLPVLIVVGGGAALLGSIAPMLAWLPLHMAALVLDAIVLLARVLASLPGAALHVGQWPAAWTVAAGVGLAAGLFAWWMMRRCAARTSALQSAIGASGAAVCCALLATALLSGGDGRMHVTVLDTGTSPAVLVRTAQGRTALIDGGSSPALLVQALGRVLPPTSSSIDLIVVTGGEQSAVGGLAGLRGHYNVGAVVAPVRLTPAAATIITGLQDAGAEMLAGSRAWRWDETSWSCLPASADASGHDMCALLARDASGTVLVLGDAGTAAQDELAAAYGAGLRADLLVSEAGGALSPLVLAAAQPSSIAIPAAKGSPASPNLSAPAARTGTDGDLSYAGGPDGLEEEG